MNVELLESSFLELLITVITAIMSYIGLKIKNIYENWVNSETKKKIVSATVQYVEQITKDISITSENKKEKAEDKIVEWLQEKGISISNTELDILIESAVNNLKEKLK